MWLISVSILFQLFQSGLFSVPVSVPVFRCHNLSSTSSSSSSNNKTNERNLSMQYLVSLCQCCTTVKSYLENTVHEVVSLCKIWNPHNITSTVLQNKNKNIETVRNDLCSQAAPQSASVQWKCNETLQNRKSTVDSGIHLLCLSHHYSVTVT